MRNLFLVSAVLNFFAWPYLVLLPFYVEDVLGVTTDWYGYILAGYGAGSLLGYAFYGSIRISGRSRGRLLIAFLVVFSAALSALGLTRAPVVGLALIAAAGFFSGAFNVAVITLIQLGTPDEMRGRMFGLLQTVVGGLSPISMGLTGVVADLTGQNIPIIFIACGIILIVISLTIATNRDYRDFLAGEATSGR
jgi:MFS family permease